MNVFLQHWRQASLGLAAIAIVLASAGTGSAGVLGWWAMDDANYPEGYFNVPPRTTADSSGNGNSGTLIGDVTVGVTAGQVGNAAVFPDTVSAIDCGTSSSLKPTGLGYSFATWVNVRTVGRNFQVIGADWDPYAASGERYFYHLCLNYDYMKLHLGVPGADTILTAATDTSPMAVDTWTHVAFTVEITELSSEPELCSGEVKLYRNGSLVATEGYNGYSQLPMTANPIYLGARNAGSFSLRGQLDETAIWTSAIGEADVAALAAGTATPASISPTTLGGYWTFDDTVPPLPTATVLDSSSNDYHGTMTPNGVDPFHPEGGRFGGAVRLGGPTDYIDVGDIDYDNEITIAAWVKPDALTSGVYQVVASQANDNVPSEWAWQIFLLGDQAKFYVFRTEEGNPGSQLVATATGITTDWTHLAMSIAANDGETLGEVKAYVNGVQVGETFEYDIESLVESVQPIRFGNKGNVTTAYAFKGLLDDVAIFDQALSAQDIAMLYAHGVEGWLTPPSPIPGDATGNGVVDEDDAKRLATYWGATSEQYGLTWWQMGDFNGDNKVDARDAAILAAHWGMTSAQASREGAPVPEPSLFVLLLGGGILMLARRR